MDDFNLDLLNADFHSATNEVTNALFSHFLYPLISRPTWLTSYSATLIDNIFTNNISASCDNGLIINDLSDHLPIFILCYTDAHSSTTKPNENVINRRVAKSLYPASFTKNGMEISNPPDVLPIISVITSPV